MGKEHDHIGEEHREWMERQHVFFVATAPADPTGNVNLSPKGYDTFRVIDDRTVAYLDLTGSGIETLSHLAERDRLTIMFCAFEGKPRILRLYGTGRYLRPHDEGFGDLHERFGAFTATRGIVELSVERVRSSCGYSIPFMEHAGERETLKDWADRKGSDGIEAYWRDRNAESIDGRPGLTE